MRELWNIRVAAGAKKIIEKAGDEETVMGKWLLEVGWKQMYHKTVGLEEELLKRLLEEGRSNQIKG